ncbi:MAG: Bax inhibitor-1/YccA family protein [Aquihabitans sp.]
MSNPALNPKIFQKETAANQQSGAFEPGWGSPADELPPNVFGAQAGAAAAGAGAGQTLRPPATSGGDTMRISGTMTATAILLLILMVSAVFGWQALDLVKLGTNAAGQTVYAPLKIPAWIFAAWIGTFVLAMVTIFKPRLARITAPIYAVGEGLVLGSISAIFEASYPGIVVQAVLLTFGVFITMMVLFATGTIRVTEKLRMGIFAAMGAIFFLYLVDIVVGLFGGNLPLVDSSSPWGIGFSVVVVIVASLNLLLNFDFIKQAVDYQAPRYMEWFAAFGLMLALVWLYLEILRLLAKLRN